MNDKIIVVNYRHAGTSSHLCVQHYIIYSFQTGVNTDSGQTVREAAFDGINE
jgi:hypothetical protein